MKIFEYQLSLSEISDISTTLGMFISTLTLISAYNLYRFNKRDEFIKGIRNLLISYQYNSVSLNNLISYDITHELVNNVIYSKSLDRILNRIYNKHFYEKKTIYDPEKIRDIVDEEFPPITVSIHTELLNQYNYLLKNNSQEASKIYTDYPSLYRVYESVNFIFSQTIGISKNIARDEEIFIDVIVDSIENDEKFDDIDSFKEHFYYKFMSIITQKHRENDQHDINDVLELLNLTTNSFMRMNDKELYKHMSKEKKISYVDFDVTTNIFEDLIEAEKGLGLILSHEEILKFRELSTKIKVRNDK